MEKKTAQPLRIRDADFTLIRACLTVLEVESKHPQLVAVALEALARIERGDK